MFPVDDARVGLELDLKRPLTELERAIFDSAYSSGYRQHDHETDARQPRCTVETCACRQRPAPTLTEALARGDRP